MKPSDLLKSAERQLPSGRGRPLDADLRRAASTAYYALFHRLAQCCAQSVVGSQDDAVGRIAWRRAYRSLDHGLARRMCSHSNIRHFPDEIRDIAKRFVDLQTVRLSADYDPHGTLFKSDVEEYIASARDALGGFENVSRRHRRAFAAHLLFRPRG